jgi:hypothetical protein
MLRKVILNIIKENHGLHEDDVISEHMIPTILNEETEFLSDNNLNSLKRHYMTYIKDSMSYDSLIISKISTRSKKSVSCASMISSPSVLSNDTKASKISEKYNSYYLNPQLLSSIMHFYPNMTLRNAGTILRRNLKKIKIVWVMKNFIKSQTILVHI